MAVAITKENYDQEVAESTQPVVIDVYASWCGPCQYMTPIFESVEKELKHQYKFAKLNVDEARELSIKFGVTTVPTFLFIKNNDIKGRRSGSMSKDELKATIEEFLS